MAAMKDAAALKDVFAPRLLRSRLLRSFRYATRGVVWMFRHEPNLRIHVLAAVAVVGGGLALGLPVERWAALVFAVVLVLVSETTNTAIEAVLDLVQPDDHPLVQVVKDVAAAAVLVAAAGAALIGALVFVPAVWQLLR